ncbi:unnamed protein product [Caenorhabditis angaria]|uniref:H15 domain-containing protein n=1 Tax=Caenorhabditis angaria TaxID=860376 RepID=A0A9P1IV56_9PELO|nr:unnamed protein product [Caenorhabditis angaria]
MSTFEHQIDELQDQEPQFEANNKKFDDMTMNFVKMANRLDSSTNEKSLNFILLGKPHKEKQINHPTYLEMIQGAIRAINNGKGSSRTEILKYIAQNYHLSENLPKVNLNLNTALKKAVNSGDLEQSPRERSGSFTLSSEHEKNLQLMPINRSTPIKMLEAVRKNVEKPAKKQATKKRSQKIAKIKKVPTPSTTSMKLRNRK